MRIFDREYHQPKRFVTGTHRARTPAETLADFGRHQQTMGITRLANVTGLDVIGIPVYMAVRQNSRSIAVSQGKGLDRGAGLGADGVGGVMACRNPRPSPAIRLGGLATP
jgi:ribosomal protein S12 methylthiotransferase accessory factor